MEKLFLFLDVIAYCVIIWFLIHVIFISYLNSKIRKKNKTSVLLFEKVKEIDINFNAFILCVISVIYLIVF